MMRDRGALMQAIKANPDDDTPRLVYADCIEEDGEHQRAEFIRVQCAIAREWQPEDVTLSWLLISTRESAKRLCQKCRKIEGDALCAYHTLREREIPLLRWLDYTLRLLSLYMVWERGFIQYVKCPWLDWLAHGDRLREVEWVPVVELTTMPEILWENDERTRCYIARMTLTHSMSKSTFHVSHLAAGRERVINRDLRVFDLRAAENLLPREWLGTRFKLPQNANEDDGDVEDSELYGVYSARDDLTAPSPPSQSESASG